MDRLDPRTTALVLIDLQGGILPFVQGPYNSGQVVAAGADLARRFRTVGAPVVLVRIGFSDGFADMLRQPTDQPPPIGDSLPANWWEQPAELEAAPADIQIIKRHWGAFHGTELDLQLRRRGITTVVLGGIATNYGVESTARTGWELGYAMVLVEDAMSAPAAEMHAFAVQRIFPRLGRVRKTAEVLAALA